mmetsp:Transcript_68098/g.106977  ORF Transcript_68098/g.106977 Transcript_68098/m.106977 type:complete len:200 (-) Transcript_68098:78-677(-)
MSTANTTTCSAFLSMAAFHQKATTFSWVTTWTVESKAWRPSSSSSLTRSSSLRTSSCFVETMSVHPSPVSMASTMNASDGTTSNCGSNSVMCSTACPCVPSLMRRLCACMAAFPPRSTASIRSNASLAPLTCRTRALFAISCGQIRTRTSRAGQRTTVVYPLSSALTSLQTFCRNKIWTWCAGPTKWSRMAMSSLQSAS